MAAPQSAPLSTLLTFGPQGALTQDANGQWMVSTTDNEGNTHLSPYQDQLTPDQWSAFQNAMGKGYYDVSAPSMNSDTGTHNAGGAVRFSNNAPTIGGMPWSLVQDAGNMGAGFTPVPLGGNSSGPSQVAGGLKDPSKVYFDPNWGWITPQSNTHLADESGLDKFSDILSSIVPALVPLAFTGALGAAGGSALLGGLPGVAQGVSGGNYGGLVSSILQGLGLPGWAGTLGSTAINASKGGGINPLQVLMTLGKMAQSGGGNG